MDGPSTTITRHPVDTFQMSCLAAGDSGPVLLLVHGFPLDRTMWQAQWEALAGRFRVLAPDLRGFGASMSDDAVVGMDRMADDLALLLEARGIDEPVFFCGLSMGGYVAWQFWKRHPQKLRALILCDTRAAADDAEGAAGRVRMAQHVLEKGTRVVAEAMLPKLFAPATPAHRPELVDQMRQVILRTRPEAIAAAQRGMAARPDVTPWLGQINVPALLIVGGHDAITPPEEMRTVAAAMPDAELMVVPDAGHMAPLENPDPVNQAIARLAERAK